MTLFTAPRQACPITASKDSTEFMGGCSLQDINYYNPMCFNKIVTYNLKYGSLLKGFKKFRTVG